MSSTCVATLNRWEERITAYLQSSVEHDDASHDISHCQRVWKTARQIMAQESVPVNSLVVLAACYLHDVVVLPKDHPQRATASSLAAAKAGTVLAEMGFPGELIDNVCHSVASHSYSAGITPQTIEARVVQDADRMEALGAIGLARVFYTAGVLRQKMFDPQDPKALYRELDDRRFALDHFELKLLRLADTMQTDAGRTMAQRNADYLRAFAAKLLRELDGDYS